MSLPYNKTGYKAQAPGEKRLGKTAVPLNYRQHLNDVQRAALKQMATFGWQVAFVRRDESFAITVIVNNFRTKCYGRLCADGSIALDSSLDIRQ